VKLLKSRESGQTMVMALILLAVGSLMVVPMLNQSFTNLGYHQSIECRTLTSYSADAGMEYVLCKLYNAPGAYTDPDNPLQESLTLNDRTVNVTAGYEGGGVYKITSVASGGGCGSTTIEAYVNLSAGSFAFTIAAKDYMHIENAMVDADEPGGATIHSNGDIVITGSVSKTVVDGDASAVDSISIGNPDSLTGIVTCPSPPVQFPGDYTELYKTMAQEGDIYTQNVTLDDGTLEDPIEFGPAYIEGNLAIAPNSFVELTGTVYVTGIIEVKPGSLLEGEENMLAEQGITIEGGEYLSDRIPVVISTGGDILCTKGIINAVVYAPNGIVTITGDTHLYGAVGGNTVEVINAAITYAAELHGRQDLPGGELSTISYIYK